MGEKENYLKKILAENVRQSGSVSEDRFRKAVKDLNDPSAYELFEFNPGEKVRKYCRWFLSNYSLFSDPFSSRQTTTYSLLFFAHQYKNNLVFQLLVDRGADLLWRNNRGSNVLQLLAKVGNIECARICLTRLKDTSPYKIPEFISNKNAKGNKTTAFHCFLTRTLSK